MLMMDLPKGRIGEIVKNISVIVFSKGRPMQLHAYLESLLKYSEIKQSDIQVLYCPTEGIRYEKVMNTFAEVKWYTEQKFEEDLKRAVKAAGEYIMFGCDDVVFTHSFSLNKAADYLEKNDDVFGFSMRLGNNIEPHPVNVKCHDGVMEWNWQEAGMLHFDYPWELDCTLYRKSDVEKLIAEEEKTIKNPNYFEAMINDDNRDSRITRKHMACNQATGCAVVITVNRVQDSYQNGFDDSMLTDIVSLDKQYNDEDNTLDIEKISAKGNNKVHVESEYFILRKESKGYDASSLRKKKLKNIGRKLVRFPKKTYNYIERRIYRNGLMENRLKILSTKDTLDAIKNGEKSFIRFGNSDIELMQGKPTPAQQCDDSLVIKMKEVLSARYDDLMIGIPYYYVYPQKNLTPYINVHALSIADQRRFLFKNCNRNMTYMDSCITQAYQIYEEYNFKEHFSTLKEMFKGRDITVICGEGVLDRIENKMFEVCNSIDYIFAPSMEAYSEFDKTLEKACKTDKNRTVCLILGSTAKPLAFELYKKGYKVWDIGHMFKDYDYWCKKKARTEAEIMQFYMPD